MGTSERASRVLPVCARLRRRDFDSGALDEDRAGRRWGDPRVGAGRHRLSRRLQRLFRALGVLGIGDRPAEALNELGRAVVAVEMR